jgi:hypothetical protein
MNLEEIPTVSIDPEGRFKYILARITDNQGNQKLVVRGRRDAKEHAALVKELKKNIGDMNLEILGGGWIAFIENDKCILILMGSSFGTADHEKTAQLLREAFPGHECCPS